MATLRPPTRAPAAALPDDPARRAIDPALLAPRFGQGARSLPGCRLDRGRWPRFAAAAERHRRRDPRPQGRAASYHLSCVVDDAASGVTLVVRGADLRASTPIQRLLQQLLGLPEPAYLHHPLLAHEDGRRLAKRDLAPTLAAMRENGVDGPTLAAAPARRQASAWFRFRGRLKRRRMRIAPAHPAPARHGRDRLCPRARRHRDGLGQGRDRRAVSRTGCASACCSRRSRSSSSS